MKNVTKLLLVLLALAVMLSCACVFASADNEVTAENADDILEYFEMPVYCNLDGKYESDDAAAAAIRAQVGADATLLPYVTTTKDEDATEDGYYFSVIPKSGSSIEFRGDVTGRTIYTLETRFAVSRYAATRYGYARLFYQYMDGNEVKSVKLGSDIKETKNKVNGAWINASIVMTPTQVETANGMVDGYSVVYSLKNDAGSVIDSNTEAPELIPGDVSGFSMTFTTVGAPTDASTPYHSSKIDYIRMYGGSFPRALVNYENEVDEKLVGLMKLYNETQDDALKLRILENINKVTSPAVYNYSPVSQDAKEAAAAAANAIVGFYSGKLVSSVAEINAEGTYEERAAKVAEIAVFAVAIPDTYAGDDADAVLAAKAAYQIEADALAIMKEQSEGYLKALDPLTSLVFPYTVDDVTYSNIAKFLAAKNYVELKAYYDSVVSFAPCDTFPGVAESLGVKDALFSDFIARTDRAEAFLADMAIVADDTNDFGTKYVAYLDAGEQMFSDESLEGVSEALALYTQFGIDSADIVKTAQDFIIAVGNAKMSTYYSQKIDYLDKASAIVAQVDLTYPGAADSRAEYDALLSTLETQKSDVDAFINAVAAINDSMTFMQKKEAVDTALALQEKGSINGFEGVSEANIKLSAYESEIKTPEGYSLCFIEYVNRAKEATDLLSRRSAIMNAKAIIDFVENDYDGITAAKVALDEAINAYNNTVKTLNGEFTETASRAVEVTSAAAPADCVKQVVAILKKIFVD